MSFFQFLKSKTFLIQIAIALVIVFVIVYSLLFWLDSTTNHGEEITVPELNSLSIEEAAQKLEAVNLQYEIIDTLHYNPDYPKYGVMAQEPVANYKVKSGRTIYLKVNASDYQIVSVPDLVQKTLRQAEPTLQAIGLVVGEITYEPYLAKDMVLEMKYKGKTINPGDKLPKTAAIDLTLGDGSIAFDENNYESPDDENSEENPTP
uniref:PASTA domain-containing protein n=1 Tax=Flavobacterium sp. TaxID=239 RepID=UPI00404A3F5A